MDEQALNKKLAAWVGFKWRKSQSSGVSGDVWCWLHPGWKYGNGKWSFDVPNFTQSLDACFKWLVPKLWICEMEMLEGIFFVWEVAHPKMNGGNWVKGRAEESAALALCSAIEKLIDQESLVRRAETLRIQIEDPGPWGTG